MIDPNDQPDGGTPRARVNGRRAAEAQDDRVRKLETALTELEAKVAEDALAERVLAKLTTAARQLPGGTLFDASGAVTSTALALAAPSPGQPMSTPPPPGGAVLHLPVAPDPAPRGWFLFQFWAELRLMVRMYFDPRYRISRVAQFLLPVTLGMFALNYFLFAVWFAIPVVSPVLERAVCVLLGVFFYKVMTRELARYRDVLDYLARYGQNNS